MMSLATTLLASAGQRAIAGARPSSAVYPAPLTVSAPLRAAERATGASGVRGHEARGRSFGSSTVARAASEAAPSAPSETVTSDDFDLCCPICNTTSFTLSSQPSSSTTLDCARCGRSFAADEEGVDLTLTSGVTESVYQQQMWTGTTLFETPQISFLYERGWRQGFSRAGFPGPDAEFDLALDYLRPASGGKVVDLSCGSGLFTRRFAKCDMFTGVIALDYSENMLKQTKTFIEEDKTIEKDRVLLLRADVGRLPFKTGSVDAIHAGAAIHCWPDPRLAMAEISRVLKPGGVFVGTTFMYAYAPLGQIFGDDLVRPLKALDPYSNGTFARQMKFWEEKELREIVGSVGLQGFSRYRNNQFIMFSASKPLM